MPPVSQLKELPGPIRRRLLERFLKDSGVREPEQVHILQMESLVFHWSPSASMQFPGGVTIGREYDRLVKRERVQTLPTVPLQCPGRTEIPELGAAVLCTPADTLSGDDFYVRPQGTLVLRSRMAGDCMTLSGGTKSLKKLYIDRKIPASNRPMVPVLADDRGVLAVFGLGVSEERRALTLPAVWVRLVSYNQEENNGGTENGK